MNERAKEVFGRGLEELGMTLTGSELSKFYLLADELGKWSRKINLTAIRGDEDMAVKHFLDSLTLLRVIGTKGSLLDIGSGGGFPALPVKIVRPDLHVVSVDAVEKKIIFQRHAARLLCLHHFNALHVRGEELAGTYAGHFDRVVSRAFSDIPTFVRMALPLVKETGKIVAMKGRGGKDEAHAAERPLTDMGARVTEVVEFALPVSGDARSLVVVERL